MMRISSIFFSLLFTITHAQQPATSSKKVQEGILQKEALLKTSLVKNLPFVNIGPTIMSGRVVDIDANPQNPAEFYVAYASGGLWHTINNGITFEPLMDNASTVNIGDIAVSWKDGTIWVGTGEHNASRSSYAGVGLLKSTDRGKSWSNIGLLDSHHIGRILINPDNVDEIVVGVTGHLYSSNSERGIYKTIDGGQTWEQTLFVNDATGVIDLTHVPQKFDVMYASSWQKDRKAWNFEGNGTGSAIYKSEDAGSTWTRISIADSGFPTGEGVGRIGLAVYDEKTIYAIHDSQFRRDKEKEIKSKGIKKEDFKTMTTEEFMTLKDVELDNFLKKNDFQEKYRSENVKQLVRSGAVKPIDLAKYLEDANSQLFDTPVIGTEVYRSIDGGKSWKKMHEDYLDDIFYSYGYYFGQIRVSPGDQDKIYIMGVPILKSKDGGITYESISAKNVHPDHHALWINPENPKHLINGNDGGVNISYDEGKHWIKANQPAVGQFYAINVDSQKPYNVYGGLQDNGVWMGAHNIEEDQEWHQMGNYPWDNILGGDGMQIQIDSRFPHTIYTGYQFGNYYRIHPGTKKKKNIQPKHELGISPYRFNWQTPILLSSHQQDILYLGANKLLRSMNKGDDWTAISKDLTHGGKKGNVAYGTLTAISESPFQFGLLYTGSDDGLVYVSKNTGGSWDKISDSFPKDLWVSRVIASQHKVARVYVTLNGYRWDDFTPYVYKSDDYGVTWQDIGRSLPISSVNVIREDPKNENVLYLGTDNGIYVSLDMGTQWQPFSNGLPSVAVHDLVVQKEAGDLLVGTHGRSIYKTNIKAIQGITPKILESELTLFEIAPVSWSEDWGDSWSVWFNADDPEMKFSYYANNEQEGSVTISTKKRIVLHQFDLKFFKGLGEAKYDLSILKSGKIALEKQDQDLEISKKKSGKYYLPKGTYTIIIKTAKATVSKDFEVK